MRADLPKFGRTKQAHAEAMLTEAAATVATALKQISTPRRMRPLEREALSRQLAGVVGSCEAVRIWLGCGAPK